MREIRTSGLTRGEEVVLRHRLLSYSTDGSGAQISNLKFDSAVHSLQATTDLSRPASQILNLQSEIPSAERVRESRLCTRSWFASSNQRCHADSTLFDH
jgi:hypothetical protein